MENEKSALHKKLTTNATKDVSKNVLVAMNERFKSISIESAESDGDYFVLIIGDVLGYRTVFIGLSENHCLSFKNEDHKDFPELVFNGKIEFVGRQPMQYIQSLLPEDKWIIAISCHNEKTPIDINLVKMLNSEEDVKEILFLESISSKDGEVVDIQYLSNEANKVIEQLKKIEQFEKRNTTKMKKPTMHRMIPKMPKK